MKNRPTFIQIVREDAGDDMRLEVPIPPLVIIQGRVCCDRCSTSHEPENKRDPYPQCPWCGSIIDLSAYMGRDPPDLPPAA
jgi:hypothetical protein